MPAPQHPHIPVVSGQWTVLQRSLVGRLPQREVTVRAPGALLAAVAHACDGRTGWAEVVAQLGLRWAPARVEGFLQALARAGLLAEAGARCAQEPATFDDRPLAATCLQAVAAAQLQQAAQRCLVAVLRPLDALEPGVYAATGNTLHRLPCDPAHAWRCVSDPRVLQFASALLLPLVRAAGEDARLQAVFAAGQALERARTSLARANAVAASRTDLVAAPVLRAAGLPPQAGWQVLPGVVLGAAPTGEQVAQQGADRWLRLQPLPGPGFAWAAGPIPSGHGELQAGGRSTDPRLALRKAEAEAWERLGWARLGQVRAAAFGQLASALDPSACIAYHPAQYRKAGFPFAPFSRRRHYLWKPGVDARTGTAAWLPADCLVAHSALPAPHALRALTSASTSGIAAWTDAEGALCRAVLELLERDAVLRAWLPGRPHPQLDPRSLPAHLQQRVRALEQSGHRVRIAAIGEGLVPVFSVFVQHAGLPFTALTAAAAFDAEHAVSKALDEAEGHAAHASAFPARALRSPRAVRTVQDVVHLFRQRRWFRCSDFYAAGPQSQHFGGHVRACGDWPQLRDRLPVLAFDLTPPGAAVDQGRTSLHVVRAVVPGLLPVWFGHGLQPAGLAGFRRLQPRWRHLPPLPFA